MLYRVSRCTELLRGERCFRIWGEALRKVACGISWAVIFIFGLPRLSDRKEVSASIGGERENKDFKLQSFINQITELDLHKNRCY